MKKSLANTCRKQITSLELSNTCALSTEPIESQSHEQETGCHEQLLSLRRGNKDSGRQSIPQPRQNPLFIISVTLKYIPSLIPREDKCLFKGGGEVGSGSQHIKKKIKKNQTKPTPQNKTDFIASDQSS